ncbi:MAG: zinc ABC transporter substrate-binding protein [candidate division WOR-3 bacterium]|nr:MAG: zinc ABC transporter substrate-binding protein [candidate division WOR-3 bacterium]
MKKTLTVLVSIVAVIIVGCAQRERHPEKITVVVSIVPLAEFAEEIGGDKVRVSVMVSPGASPHTYEPTSGQLIEVSKAKLYIKVGAPIEFELAWLDRILSTNRGLSIINASAGIHLQQHEHTSQDPHVWLSPKNAKTMVENIYKGLVVIDSVNEQYYADNKKRYLAQIDRLDREIEKILEKKINRKFMVFHPSWGYFARDYKIEQIPVEAEGKEPTARDIQHLIEQAKKSHITVVFASPQFNMESAEVIAREIQGSVVIIDPLAKDYITNMKKVAQALSEAME